MFYKTIVIALAVSAIFSILSGCSSSNVDSGKFLSKAMQDGAAEIQVCQMAQQKSTNEDVKKFAQRMIEDHGKIDQEISSLAKQKNITLPQELSSEKKSTVENLSKLSGKDFDKEFMSHNVEDHQTDIKDFQEQVEKGTDADVKAFAQRTLQTLKTHLELSKEVDNKVKS